MSEIAALVESYRRQQGIVSQGSNLVGGLLYVVTYASGLEPGRMLEQTFEFVPANGGASRYYGGAANPTQENGTNYGVDVLSYVNPQHEPGTLRGWWREVGSKVDAEPIPLPDGTAELVLSIP